MMTDFNIIRTESVLTKLKEEWRILKEILDQGFEEKHTIAENGLRLTERVISEKLKIQQMKVDLLLDLLSDTK